MEVWRAEEWRDGGQQGRGDSRAEAWREWGQGREIERTGKHGKSWSQKELGVGSGSMKGGRGKVLGKDEGVGSENNREKEREIERERERKRVQNKSNTHSVID